MGNSPSNLPTGRRSPKNKGHNRLSTVSTLYEDTYISPGGFETPRTEFSISDVDTKPTVTASPEPAGPAPVEFVSRIDEVEEEEEPETRETHEDHEVPLNSRTLYTFSNVGSGAAIDVAGGDRKNIIGWPLHSAENQQWQLIEHGGGHAIYNPGSKQYLHLTIEDGGNRIVASRSPVTWFIQQVEGREKTYRILWHDEALSLYLEDSTPGTKVQLKRNEVDNERQLWKLTPCGTVIPQQETTEVRRRSLPPQVVDTVISLDGESKVVRTTTTVTTITTVTETPCSHCPL